MKHCRLLIPLFVAFISLDGFCQVIFTEDFDGSNATNIPVVDPDCGSGDNQDFFGIVDDATIGASYTNDSGLFLAGQDVDGPDCSGGPISADEWAYANWTAIDISTCSGNLYICVDLAEDDLGSDGLPDFDLDANDGIEINVDVDGAGLNTVVEFKSTASNTVAYAGQDAAASCVLTDDFVTYCATIPVGTALDIQIGIRSNGGSEDTAADNIQIICGVENLPASANDYSSCFVQSLFTEDFDGSNATNPPAIDVDCGTGDDQDYFGIVDDSSVGASYSNDSGNFLGGQDVDGGDCSGAASSDAWAYATWTGINIASCSSDLILCIDLAEDDLGSDGLPDFDLDASDGIEINVSVDGGSFNKVIEFKSDAGNSPAYADRDPASSCQLTDDFLTYCVAVPTGGLLDIEIGIRSNGGSEDLAADNIQLYCGEADLPATAIMYGSCEPSCNSSLVITEVMYDPCSGSSGTTDCLGGGSYWDVDGSGEWVEIYNYGMATSDISGYIIGDENSGNDIYVIPAGTMIAPGEYLVIAHETIGNCMIAGGINAVVGLDPDDTSLPQSGNDTWNNSPDDVELKDPTGTLLCDIISQYPTEDCTDMNDGYSYSLLLDPSTFTDGSENDDLADWGPSLNGATVATFGGGTPGEANALGACVSNIGSVAATCNEGMVEFTVTFDYDNSFTEDFDVLIDGVVTATSTGNALGAGSISYVVSMAGSLSASTADIEVRPSGAPANSCFELDIEDFPLPACLFECPDVAEVDGADDVCNSGLLTEIADWQLLVGADADNLAALADGNTDGTIVYSTVVASATVAPDGNTANGVHSQTNSCATEVQTSYAYLLCHGEDGISGNADDSYLLLGTHSLSVYPVVQAPTISLASSGVNCSYFVSFACIGDDSDTIVANEACGMAVGSQQVTVESANGCTETFSVAVPACPTCPSIDVGISDPCHCDAGIPPNVDLNNNGIIDSDDLVSDIIQIVVNPAIAGEVWTVSEPASAMNADQTGITVGTPMVETAVGSGIYELEIFYPADGSGYGTMTFTSSAGNLPQNISNNTPCDCEIFDLALAKVYLDFVDNDADMAVGLGDIVTYTITVTNQGNEEAVNVDVTDYFTAGELIYQSATLSSTSASVATILDNGVDGYTIDLVPVGSSVSVELDFIVDPTFTGDDITNTAEINAALNGNGAPGIDIDSGFSDGAGDDFGLSAIDLGCPPCPTGLSLERVLAGNAIYALNPNTGVAIANASAVYVWYLLDENGMWQPVASVTGLPYYSPAVEGVYSVEVFMISSDCPCVAVGTQQFSVEEVVSCKNCWEAENE